MIALSLREIRDLTGGQVHGTDNPDAVRAALAAVTSSGVTS